MIRLVDLGLQRRVDALVAAHCGGIGVGTELARERRRLVGVGRQQGDQVRAGVTENDRLSVDRRLFPDAAARRRDFNRDMSAKGPHAPRAGDWLEAREPRGMPTRRGQILEVLGRPGHEHYRVRWDERHESIVYPADGVHVIPKNAILKKVQR